VGDSLVGKKCRHRLVDGILPTLKRKGRRPVHTRVLGSELGLRGGLRNGMSTAGACFCFTGSSRIGRLKTRLGIRRSD